MINLFNKNLDDIPEIKYETNYFKTRLIKIQNLIKSSQYESLLLICGIHGNENKENNKLINWLFNGKNGNEWINYNLDECLNETILMIQENSVSIFLTHIGYRYLKNFLINIEDLSIFVIEKEIEKKSEEFERLKIREFYKMTEKFNSVGFLFDGEFEKRNTKDVEKWPLIQGYALEGVGEVIFSIKKVVFDATTNINDIYFHIDEINKIKIIDYESKHLIKNFIQITEILDNLKLKNKHKEINQKELTDILRNIDEINCLNKNNINFELPKPSVLIGKYITNNYKNKVENINLSKCSYNEGFNPIHILIENSDSTNGLRVARTYFLTSNIRILPIIEEKINDEGFLNGYEIIYKKDKQFFDEFKLSLIYIKLLHFYFKFIKNLKKNLNLKVL